MNPLTNVNRVQILDEIDRLEQKSKNFPQLNHKYNKEIRRLGKQLLLPKRMAKEQAIVRKGQDMTYSEVMWLHNQQGYTYKDIARVLGMSIVKFNHYLKLHQGKIKIHVNDELENMKHILRESDSTIEKNSI
ncbi:sigma factor-like helix-turn-helix DNA-binding protein [Tenuibacillus multivorans]|uniref:Sigma-70, region 4 n=1 Tax=Tenuibacillus multivorans TaxID=237069 RepID=A0A1H0CKC1_9BACI|nr:sigma factor-like helix-turn-helix DNA-binding protein [Tenuibacillus multivorans]GEL76261.1 hypothetical protein TMU01_04960 [Tenuibacillus multivorans]SDN58319.1 Sigma-70, region 4 [Tenuibacillus multivorans]